MLPTRLNRAVIYESPWVSLYRDRVALPSGQVIEQFHVLEFGRGAVAVIVENAQGEILMEQVSRYATGTTTWELPAGRIETGETALEAAHREVLEETGYETADHRQIYTYHPLNGISNMKVYVVRCRAGQGSGLWDQNEVDGFAWFSPEEVKAMIRDGEITDGLALVGLLLHFSGV
jgi:8-oxo-dGTP pyrophosphatase MutT (NUDIX family)